MSVAFETACYRASIEQVTASVFATLLGLEVHPASSHHKSRADFTAAVYYAGAWQGALLLECSALQAEMWATRLMSLVPPVDLDDARDSLGEIANVLAGNLKPLLPSGVGLSIPSVVQGADYSFRICGENSRETLHFADDTGTFCVTLWVIENH